MDIVGSILKKMTAPPVMDEKERKLRQKHLEIQKKQREAEQKQMQDFRQQITKRISAFDSDDEQGPRLKFEPMDKLRRTIVYDAVESASLVALSFGEEDVDRHVIVFRQHTVPSEPEIIAMRRNKEYIPLAQEDEDVEEEEKAVRKTKTKSQPEYLKKYDKHLGGLAVAKDAAKTTVTQRSYGFVSSEQKKDKRTIEETLADIRARKRQKVDTPHKSQD